MRGTGWLPSLGIADRSAAGLRLLAQFSRARKHLVLDVANRDRADRRIHPLAVLQHLTKDADPHAIAAQLATENIGGRLEALAVRGSRGIPIGDDDAAERIGRCKRHEAERVERPAPEIGVYPECTPSGIRTRLWTAGSVLSSAEDQAAVT